MTEPLAVQANYMDQVHNALLISLKGMVRWNDQGFYTASTAAKAVAIDWKVVIGRDFWYYQGPGSGNWEKIGKLCKSGKN